MSKIIDRTAATTIEFHRIDTDRLGSVILVDDLRPAVDLATGEQRQDRATALPLWLATVQVPGMRGRDADGAFLEIGLRVACAKPPQLGAPTLIELGGATVTVSNARTDSGSRGQLRIKASSIRASTNPPAVDLDGLPISLPGRIVRWMGVRPAKGFGGNPRLDAGQQVHIAQVLVDEEGVRRETGEPFTARRPFTVEIVGAAVEQARALVPLQLVEIDRPAVQLSVDEFGRRARLTLTAPIIRPAPAQVAPSASKAPKEQGADKEAGATAA